MWVFRTIKIVQWQKSSEDIVTCNNLTLINFLLINIGPTREPKLTLILMLLQVFLYKNVILTIYIYIFSLIWNYVHLTYESFRLCVAV